MNPLTKTYPVIRTAGDTGLIVEFGEGIHPEINQKIRTITAAFKDKNLSGVLEIIPSYRSLLFIYDPVKTSPDRLISHLETIEHEAVANNNISGRCIDIPVCYGETFGPDIQNVCDSAGLDQESVIALHSDPEYLIYMVGFTPGFPFLGGLNEKLSTPRLETPRVSVPAGSVGIANNQTGMYPIASPGGWQIIGRTPLTLFAPDRKNPFLYEAGDKIKFVPISKEKFHQIQQQETADGCI